MRGITFGNIHTDDMNLILSSVNIPPAQPKTNYIDIPGADGQVDLTEALGVVKYQMREAEFVFTTAPGHNIEDVKRKVSNTLNGVYFDKIVLDKDPEWYWQGRVRVDGYGNEYPCDKITVKATLKPYKYRDNVIKFRSTKAQDTRTVVLYNENKVVLPKFITANSGVRISCNGNSTYIAPNTTFSSTDFALEKGNNQLDFTIYFISQDFTIKYTEGSL
ncbi:MAG: hypothetical protein ACI4HZ_06140 [Ruminococcus sp.]